MAKIVSKRGVIRLRVKDLTRLFNSLDPDPFIERDLDDDAVEYITSWASEIPSNRELQLEVTLTEPSQPGDREAILHAAVRNYFSHAEQLARIQFRQLMRRGRLSLLIGLTVLTVAFLGSNLLAHFATGTVGKMVKETVMIGGWVAMWRPMEIFLYDWWPLRRKRLDLARLRDMSVQVKLPGDD